MATTIPSNPYETQLLEMEAKQDSSPVEKHASDIPINSLFSLSPNQLKSLPSFQHATSNTPMRTSPVENQKPAFGNNPRTTMVTMPSATTVATPPPPMRPLATGRPSTGAAPRAKSAARKSRASTGKKAGAKRARSDSLGGDEDYDEEGDEADEEPALNTKIEETHAVSQPQPSQYAPTPMMPPPLPVDLSNINMEEQPNSHLINPLPPLNFPVHNHSFVASAGFIVERPDKNNITRRYVHYRCAFCGKDTNDKSRHSKHELACSRGAAKSTNKPPKKAKTRQPEVRGNTIIYPSRPPMIMDANGNLTGVIHPPLAAPLTPQPSLPSAAGVPTLPPVASTLSFEPTLGNGANQQHLPSDQQQINATVGGSMDGNQSIAHA